MPENPSRSPPTIGTQVTAFAKRIKRKVRKAVSFRRNSWIQPNSREGGNRWRFRDGKPCKELPGTQMGPPVLIQVWAFFFGGFKHLINQNSLPNNMDESPPKDEQKFWNHLFFNMFFFFFRRNGLHLPGCFRVVKGLDLPSWNNVAFHGFGGWWEWCFLKIIIKIQTSQISFLLVGRRKAKRRRFEENLSWKIVENCQTWIIFAKDWG